MESDERFKHLATDPRFRRLKRSQRKVEIDDRFKSMFTDEKFSAKSRDKRGHKRRNTNDLKKYYSLKDDELKTDQSKFPSKSVQEDDEDNPDVDDEEEEEEEEKEHTETSSSKTESEGEEKVDSEEEQADSDDDETASSDKSSSSDESESDEDADELDKINNIEYDWQPLDHDAEKADTTSNRLAILNLDWDHLDVRDIYTLVNSIRRPLSVKIYISDFGKERLKQEVLEGPKELADMPKVDEVEEEYNMLKDKMRALKNPESKSLKINEYEDADDVFDPKNEEMRERIRRYQLSKMKYYYAVATFDSVESAELVYKELDGMEYEGSSLELDLRFIPDDIEFDDSDLKAECNEEPDLATYKAPQFINDALQQTSVKLSWDETDLKRQEKLHRAYTKEELEKDDLEAYLASETDSDEEEEDDEDGKSKYQKLLQKLAEEEEERKKKVDVDVQWDESGSENGKIDQAETDDEIGKDQDDNDDYDDSVSTGGDLNNDEQTEDENGEELNLMVMDEGPKDEFKFNPDDERFKAIYDSALYNIDPSHPNFKRTEAFDVIAEKKRSKRQKSS